jgi:hypothetical protein
MAQNPRELAEALLDAQVAFLEAQLTPEQLGPLLEQEIDHALATAEQLTLGDVVTRTQIKDVARKYATAIDIPGSIPELASEIADRVYNHAAQDDNQLGDVVALRHVQAFTTKLLELPLVQERLIESPLVVEIVSEWLYRIGSDAAAQNRDLAGRIPGFGALLGAGTNLLGAVAPDAAVDLESRLRELSGQMARVILRRAKGTANTQDDPWLEDTVVDAWRERAGQPVSSLRDYVTEEDLEDLLLLVYELWLTLRETAWLQSLIDEGVDFFFDKYTDTTLLELLSEFGVSRTDMIEEANRFAPPIIELLRQNGTLNALLRRRLEPFFLSPQTLSLLG